MRLGEMERVLIITFMMIFLVGCGANVAPNNALPANAFDPVPGLPPMPGFAMINLSTSPGQVNSPNFQVSGTLPATDNLELFLDATCSISYASGLYTADPTVYGGGFLPDGAYNVWVKATYNSLGGIFSDCYDTGVTHIVDNQVPNAPTGLVTTGDANATDSDTTTWAAATDNGDAGIASYEIAVSTTTSDANIVAGGNWTDVGNVTSAKITGGLSLNDSTTYYTLVRAIDAAGLTGTFTASPGWTPPDTTPPVDPTGWTIATPTNGATTFDNTPEFSATGIAGEDGGSGKVYLNDNTCQAINQVGSATIASGSFTISNVALATDGSNDGALTFYGTLVDTAGNASNCIDLFLGYTLDTQGPTLGSIDIDSSAVYATVAGVTLTISATGATEMYITETAGCSAGGVWETYNTTKAFTITNLNTTANVYIKFRDAALNESNCVSDSIIHDDQAPTTPGVITLGGDATQYYSDTGSWTGITDNGPAGLLNYDIAISTTTSDANIITGGGWIDIATATTYQFLSGILLAPVTNYYLLLRATDNAGNISGISASASWTIFMAPTQVLNLATASKSYDQIEISWTEPNDNGTAVTDYEINYKETSSGIWLNWNDGVTTDTNEIITGLTDNTSYDFRVRGFNGAWSTWSTVHVDETLINDPFFDPNAFKAINTGGATASAVVSMDDANDISINGGAVVATLNKGDVYAFASSQFDVVDGTGRIFVAGRRGSGGNTNKANIVWSPAAWAGKNFLTNAIRTAPNIIMVYAFENSFVEIKQNGSTIQSQSLSVGGNHTFSIAPYGSYEVVSDGYIVAYTMAIGGGTNTVDPKPLLPPANDLIGVPSSSGRLTSGTSGNAFSIYHSNTTIVSNTLTAGASFTINATGTSSLFQANATRIIASSPVVANSYADANGNCAASYLPTTMMRKKYATNVQTEWVAFASNKAATITIYPPGGGSSTLDLTRTGTDINSPYKGYLAADQVAGTRFESSDRFATWYEPKTDTNGADDDETIMFGWD